LKYSGERTGKVKRPRYYCENCGTEVKKDARFCPRCGKFFSSVKCPKCDHIGEADDFASGCPVCGYADRANAAPEAWKAAPQPAAALPWWTYPAAAALVLVLVVLLLRSLA
jgi:predicted amidophosphoribosyltransferase